MNNLLSKLEEDIKYLIDISERIGRLRERIHQDMTSEIPNLKKGEHDLLECLINLREEIKEKWIGKVE